MLRVVAAAVRVLKPWPDGCQHPGTYSETQLGSLVFSVPAPGRHCHIMWLTDKVDRADAEQGFLLSDGSFADRDRAAKVAIAAKQLLPRAPTAGHWLGGLYSEDVW